MYFDGNAPLIGFFGTETSLILSLGQILVNPICGMVKNEMTWDPQDLPLLVN